MILFLLNTNRFNTIANQIMINREEILKYLPSGITLLNYSLLHDGIANSIYLITDSNQNKYILRIFNLKMSGYFGIDRNQEILIQKKLYDSGLSPKIIASDASSGFILMEYIKNPTLKDADFQNNKKIRKELIRALVYLHRKPILPDYKKLNIVERSTFYRNQIKNPSKIIEDMDASLKIFISVFNETKVPSVLCHNDLIFENIINTTNTLFIDYEYAAVGNPFVDLATLCLGNNLDEKNTHLMWRMYEEKRKIYPTLNYPNTNYNEYFRVVLILTSYMAYVWYMLLFEKIENNIITVENKENLEKYAQLAMEKFYYNRNCLIQHKYAPKNINIAEPEAIVP